MFGPYQHPERVSDATTDTSNRLLEQQYDR